MSVQLETLISGLVANPVYAFASLVGLCIGIFYGFDGWKGDTADLSFRDSPRVKNLLWILGPGVAALIGDVKVLGPNVDKALLLLVYFLPCLLAGFFVVVMWGVVVGASRAVMVRKGKSNGYGFGDALGDYFFYGYRYYRSKADAARQSQSQSPKAMTKIALFLDVDLTITEETIQQVYATELGVREPFAELENNFQKKTIDSAQFGKKLIELFASKNFSKQKAEDFFNKVRLKDWVNKLFKLQENGVAIYLVSSGPNYYIDVLASRKKVPIERTISSTYYFDSKGVISRCEAIEDDQKLDFVLKERVKFDITIGIGDNASHDKFVSVCTIAMLTTPHSNYLHVPNFSAVFSLIEKLREPVP